MDLVGGINYIENRLGGRKPGQGKDRPAHKKPRNEAAGEKNDQPETVRPAAEQDARLGQKIDITV